MTAPFLLFAGAIAEPVEGWEAFRSSHKTFQEACEAGNRLFHGRWLDVEGWYHIVSLDSEQIVAKEYYSILGDDE
jgi:hypothetical protein